MESGAISGSKADAWKKAMEEEAEVAALRVKAEGGDARTMFKLGLYYHNGTRGLKRDFTQAFTWFKWGADLEDVLALQSCGFAYLNGRGVEVSISRGVSMISVAATLGSEHSFGCLGQANEDGLHGFDQNPQEATRWYRKMQKCAHRNTIGAIREMAAAWLREHP